MIKELLDGVKSRLKGVGEKTAGGELPPAETPITEEAPPEQPEVTEEAPAVPAPEEPSVEDFTALLGEEDKSEMEGKITDLEQKTQKLESSINKTLDIAKKNSERLDSIDGNMKKFLSLYEMVTNQINPFVDNKEQVQEPIKKMVTVEGETVPEAEEEEKIVVPPVSELEPIPEEPEVIPQIAPEPVQPVVPQEPETKAEGQPEQVMFMQSIKNGTASFVLEWITSLVGEKQGLERNTQLLRYLLELGWITPKAYEAIKSHLERMMATESPQEQKESIPITIGGIPLSPNDIPSALRPKEEPQQMEPDQLVTVLGWVKYLVDKVGAKDTEEIMRYLVELDWVTPDAHKALMNYIQSAGHSVQQKPPPVDAIQRISEKISKPAIEQKEQPIPRKEAVKHAGPAQIPSMPSIEGYVMPPFEMVQKEKKRDISEVVPLDKLEDNVESLAIILEWVRHFVDKAGCQRSKTIFNYYKDIGWITGEVSDVIDRYIDSIKTPGEKQTGYQPAIEDHAATLFFIARLKKLNLTEDDVKNILS